MTKAIILSFAALALSLGAMSQVRVGVKGGLNLANISVDNDGSVDENRTLPAYHIGVIADMPLIQNVLSFQPGVFYSSKGSKLESGDKDNPTVTDPYSKYTTNPQYIEIPLNFVGKIPVGTDARLFAGIGPYFAFGVAGKNKYEFNNGLVSTSGDDGIEWDDDTPFNNDDPNQGWNKYKRFDWGGNVMVGAEISHFLLSAQYGMGFNKINSGADDGSSNKSKHRVFSVSAGFLF
ncbi:porin family protein [Chitinophaga japonensis]|uniref:Outer membrane protein with beta-barrel domain n=1 Tax=Chitinophaga japonensis TaxID=104662 RepID=A0A562TEA1_CHIJA|nr:porin family protein [Chitinophaga japonensis]TWI91842.1 outer membrane protein with beta-barrel domain [Chitinophaga japonensis]